MQQRGSVSFGLIVFLFAMGSGVAVWFYVDDDDVPANRPSVTYHSVEARPAQSPVFGTSLDVEIELEVTSHMPHVAPHVIVAAHCDSAATDDGWAFFQTLGNAQPGDRKVDTVELFRVPSLDAAPTHCDLTLSLSEGVTQPQRYCFEHGATHAGRC
jgi:hypothetical protein